MSTSHCLSNSTNEFQSTLRWHLPLHPQVWLLDWRLWYESSWTKEGFFTWSINSFQDILRFRHRYQKLTPVWRTQPLVFNDTDSYTKKRLLTLLYHNWGKGLFSYWVSSILRVSKSPLGTGVATGELIPTRRPTGQDGVPTPTKHKESHWRNDGVDLEGPSCKGPDVERQEYPWNRPSRLGDHS